MAIQFDTDAYRPFLLNEIPGAELNDNGQPATEPDWTKDLELTTTTELARQAEGRLKVLVLYGSLRER